MVEMLQETVIAHYLSKVHEVVGVRERDLYLKLQETLQQEEVGICFRCHQIKTTYLGRTICLEVHHSIMIILVLVTTSNLHLREQIHKPKTATIRACRRF